MRLYYFTTAEYGLAAIRDQRLKIAEIEQLNDPFEFLGFELSDRKFRAFLKRCKKEIGKDFGLICMSKYWNEPLMWSHYADRHKGICLGLEISAQCNRVEYIKERLPTSHLKEVWQTPPTPENISEIRDSLFYKFKAWNYEEEYRLLCHKSNQDHDTKLYFQPFGSDMQIKTVIVGCASSVRRANINAALGDKAEGIEIFKARTGFGRYEIVRNMNSSLWK